MKRAFKYVGIIILIFLLIDLKAQTLKLVHDFNPNGGSNTTEAIEFNNNVFLITDDSIHGAELWISDLNNNTFLVKDINPGSIGSKPYVLGIVNNFLIFFAQDSTGNRTLWSSDGTTNGTNNISTIEQFSTKKEHFCITDSLIFYIANDGIHGTELWVTDGTQQGTHITKDINPGIDSIGKNNLSLVNLNNKVLFPADDGIHNIELWISNGSFNDTQLLIDLDTSNTFNLPIVNFALVNNEIFFMLGSQKIYKTDGTLTGTQLLKDFSMSNEGAQSQFKFKNNIIYKTVAYASPITSYDRLWNLNITTNIATLFVNKVNESFSLNNSLYIGDSIFYFAPYSWWASNGTYSGTFDCGIDWIYSWNRLVYKDLFCYGKNFDISYGYELYINDGINNTIAFMDIFEGPESSNPHHLTVVQDKLFFIARDSLKGYQLFVTKGDISNTQMIKPIGNFNSNALPSISQGSLPKTNKYVFVNADFNNIGTELYYLDSDFPLATQQEFESLNEKVSIYPNPNTSGLFTINSKIALDRIEVNDLAGHLLFSQTINSIDLSKYPNGIYFVKCFTKEKSNSFKIIKN